MSGDLPGPYNSVGAGGTGALVPGMFAFFHAQDSPHHKNYPGLGTSLVVKW